MNVAIDWMSEIACPHGKAKTRKAQKSTKGIIIPPEVSRLRSLRSHGCRTDRRSNKAFALVASLTDVSRVPHFNLSSEICSECLAEESQKAEACSEVIQQAKSEKVSPLGLLFRLPLTAAPRLLTAGPTQGGVPQRLFSKLQRSLRGHACLPAFSILRSELACLDQ